VDTAFKGDLELCAGRFDSRLGGTFSHALLSSVDRADTIDPALREPLLFCVEYALANLFFRWNVRPSAILGIGVGEYVAAVVTGMLDIDTAVDLVAARTNVLRDSPRGHLMEVPRHSTVPGLYEKFTRVFENDRYVGLAGDANAVESAAKELIRRGVPVRLLGDYPIPTADQILALRSALSVRLGDARQPAPSLPAISGWSGGWLNEEASIDARYWADHATGAANLRDAQQELGRQFPSADIVQFGPSSWIVDMFLRSAVRRDISMRTLMETASQSDSGGICAEVLDVAGRAWAHGMPVDWSMVSFSGTGRKVVLPTYPFNKRLVWFDARTGAAHLSSETLTVGSLDHRMDRTKMGQQTAPTGKMGVDQPVARPFESSTRDGSERGRPPQQQVVDISNRSTHGTKATVHRLADVCAQVLKEDVRDYGLSFLELGGDSIRATQFIWLVEKSFQVRLDVDDVLSKSLEQLAASMEIASATTPFAPRLQSRNFLSSIQEICMSSLKVETVEPGQTFLDCGGDSIRAAQFIWQVEKQLKVRLDVDDVLSKSMAELAAVVNDALPQGELATHAMRHDSPRN
jgi:acyl transferase domain-containing protein